jgi:hypothetical protein
MGRGRMERLFSDCADQLSALVRAVGVTSIALRCLLWEEEKEHD